METMTRVKVKTKVDAFRLSLLAIGHAVTDSYGHSLLSPMFPQLAERHRLSLTQIGGLPMMMGFSASLAQPLLGLLSDWRPRWCMVAFGPLLAALFIGFVGHARSYGELSLLLFLAGMGIGAYHPQGAKLARLAGRGSNLAMSAFTVGGNVGFGLAPIMGGIYLVWLGLEHLYLSALPALVFASVMLIAFYTRPEVEPLKRQTLVSKDGGNSNPIALAALTATVVVRSAVQIGLTTFLPFLIEQKFPLHQQAAMKSLSISALLLASAVAGPLGGHLCDRFGLRRLMVWSFLLSPWPLLMACHLPGAGLMPLLSLGGFLLMLPHPGNVVMAQELMPQRAGIAASFITGFAWGVAQILALPLGKIAEITTLSAALSGLCFIPLIGILLVAPIPKHASQHYPDVTE